MPAWSTEIANKVIAEGSRIGRAFDQIHLQKLVYIAHGWCLAMTGEPLTADRPEAWDIGPMYRRLADALTFQGRKPVLKPIGVAFPLAETTTHPGQITPKMEALELDLIRRVSTEYGGLSPSQLSILTRGDAAPWANVYKSGPLREISHALIKEQFVEFAQRVSESHSHG